jgi:hypothetical protein
VSEAELLEQLCELAAAAGLRVRRIRGLPGGDGEPAAGSAVCRVRGETWVVLSGSDSVEQRIRVLAAALREHAGDWLERRYLPPTLRERIEGAD